jgi:hypothetical protein
MPDAVVRAIVIKKEYADASNIILEISVKNIAQSANQIHL